MRTLCVAALAAAFAITSLPAAGQGLAAAAAKEKERRKAVKGKTYTEADLGRTSGGNYNAPQGAPAEPAPAATAGGGAAAPAPAVQEKSADEVRAEQEKAWRQRVQQAQGDIAKTQQQIDTLQRALNDLSANLYGASRTQQIAQMEQAQKQLAASRQQLTDLEEEGRRNGWR
jgi:hypothetical protein